MHYIYIYLYIYIYTCSHASAGRNYVSCAHPYVSMRIGVTAFYRRFVLPARRIG